MKKKTTFKVMAEGNFLKGKTIPTKEEVAMMAREAVLPSIRTVLNQMSERITTLYVEQAKTAVILNSLAELLIEKSLISKQDLQARVTKNQEAAEANYRRAVGEARAKGEEKPPEPPSEPVPQTVCENGKGPPIEG